MRATVEGILDTLFRSNERLIFEVDFVVPGGSVAFAIGSANAASMTVTPERNTLSFGYTLSATEFDLDSSGQTLVNFAAGAPASVSLGTVDVDEEIWVTVWFYEGLGGIGEASAPHCQKLAPVVLEGAVGFDSFAATIRPPRILDELPPSGDLVGDLVFLTTDAKLYRWDGSAWTVEVEAADITGELLEAQIADAAITTAKFAAGIRPVRVLDSMPASGDVVGDVVYLTAHDGPFVAFKLYRWDGSAWSAAVSTTDLTGTIATAQIENAAITAEKIGNLAVQNAHMAADAVSESVLVAGAVTTTKVADDAITSPKIIAGAITTAKLDAGAVTAEKIAALTITAAQIAAGTITGAKIAAGTITAGNIEALTITAAEIAALTITGAKIAAGTISADKIVANSITAGQIAAGAISTDELAALAVTAAKIAAGTITANEIAALTITGAKIAAGTISADKLVANSITAGQIAVGAIGADEIAANAVTAAKIEAGTITADRMHIDAVLTKHVKLLEGGDPIDFLVGSDLVSRFEAYTNILGDGIRWLIFDPADPGNETLADALILRKATSAVGVMSWSGNAQFDGNVTVVGTLSADTVTGDVTVDAGDLIGATLASNILASSLTSVGTLTSLTVSGGLSLTSASHNHSILQNRALLWSSDGTGSGTFRAGIYSDASSNFIIGIGAGLTTALTIAGTLVATFMAGVVINGDLDLSGATTNDLILSSTAKLRLDGSASGDTYISESSANVISLVVAGSNALTLDGGTVTVNGRPLVVGATQPLYLDGGGDTYIHEVSSDSVQLVAGASAIATFAKAGAAGFLTLSSITDLILSSGKKVLLDGGGDTYIYESAANVMEFVVGAGSALALTTTFAQFANDRDVIIGAAKKLRLDGSSSGDTYLHESAGNQFDIVVGGALNTRFTSGHTVLPATGRLYLDGGGDTYITEDAANRFKFTAGGVDMLWLNSSALMLQAGKLFFLDGGGDTYIHESAANRITLVVGGVSSLQVDTDGITVGGDVTADDFIFA